MARYGGEEFVVLTAGVELAQARARAELVSKAIREIAFEQHGSGPAQSVTASVGVATAIPGDRALPEDLLAAADRALYQAKRQGRDRVVQAAPLRELAHAA